VHLRRYLKSSGETEGSRMLWRSVLGTGSGNSKSRLGTVLARSINGLPAIADTPAQGKVLVSGNAKRRGFPRRFRL